MTILPLYQLCRNGEIEETSIIRTWTATIIAVFTAITTIIDNIADTTTLEVRSLCTNVTATRANSKGHIWFKASNLFLTIIRSMLTGRRRLANNRTLWAGGNKSKGSQIKKCLRKNAKSSLHHLRCSLKKAMCWQLQNIRSQQPKSPRYCRKKTSKFLWNRNL